MIGELMVVRLRVVKQIKSNFTLTSLLPVGLGAKERGGVNIIMLPHLFYKPHLENGIILNTHFLIIMITINLY